jgi:hypothetical protein
MNTALNKTNPFADESGFQVTALARHIINKIHIPSIQKSLDGANVIAIQLRTIIEDVAKHKADDSPAPPYANTALKLLDALDVCIDSTDRKVETLAEIVADFEEQ